MPHVKDILPQRLRSGVGRKMTDAYHADSALEAEAGKQFRRVNGHLHLPALRAALEREVAESVDTMGQDDQVSAA
jgi:hypothetical protein